MIRGVALACLGTAFAVVACTSSSAGRPSASRPPSTAPVTIAPASSTSMVGPSTPSQSTPRPTSSSPAAVPPLGAAARAAGLVDIRTVVPDAIIDLRYATTDNFTHTQLYPSTARCLIHNTMAEPLKDAADRLRSAGYRLVFWDCYRPHSVQVTMFAIVPNPTWVARPGDYATSHESARSVDVTLAYVHRSCPTAQQVQGHCLVDMGTGFDDFTPRAYAYATRDVSAAAQSNRATLRHAMEAGGLTVYSGEWWHFDGVGSTVHRPILDVPVTG